MKLMIAKIVIRIVGTLAGLFGVFMLCAVLLEYKEEFTDGNFRWNASAFLLAGLLPLVFYLLYAAYLVWFKFSPLAVRHLCGILALYLYMTITELLKESFNVDRNREKPWPLFFLSCLIVVYFVYTITSNYLNRFLFSENVQEFPSGKNFLQGQVDAMDDDAGGEASPGAGKQEEVERGGEDGSPPSRG